MTTTIANRLLREYLFASRQFHVAKARVRAGVEQIL